MPAKSIDSYRVTLTAILEQFEPETVLEYGPGISTEIISLYPSVKKVRAVEHNENYYDLLIEKGLLNVEAIFQPDLDKYVKEHNFFEYDLIFIDGRNRSACLKDASELTNLVILHDAARSDYRDAISEYAYKVWTDSGNTVTLTNDQDIAEYIAVCLNDDICEEPELEHVNMPGTII